MSFTEEIVGHGFKAASDPVFGVVSSDLATYTFYYPYFALAEFVSTYWWIGVGTSGYWQLDMGSGFSAILTGYSLKCPDTAPSPGRMPNTWTMQGSNNESDWDTLDTVSGESGWSRTEERNYTCDVASTAYRYFRLVISSNNGDGTYLEIQEVHLYTSYETGTDSGWGDNLFTDTSSISSLSEYGASYIDNYAVDANDSTRWSSGNNQCQSWLKYDFGSGNSNAIQKINIKALSASGNGVNFFMVWGSNDDSEWDLLYADTQVDNENLQSYIFENLTAYRYYLFKFACSRGSAGECSLYTLEAFSAITGWTGKICGVTNPSKICGIAVADIAKVSGV